MIEGGHPATGTVQVGGAKNAALPIMAACLLTGDRCVIHNVPDIEDIRNMALVLESVGARVEFLGRGPCRSRRSGSLRVARPET